MKPVFLNGQPLRLAERDLLASGGEGAVYAKEGIAYKIYHPDKTPPAVAKLKELQALDHPNILGPRGLLLDGAGKVAGFSMPFRKNTDPLCQYAAPSWRTQYGIATDDISALLAKLQETLKWVHAHRCLVVDLNPYNVLVDRAATDPFIIDVDSWQTPSHPATALMDSVRDPKAGKTFTPGSDWFSFAVVACETYLAIHPYRGTHPGYKPAQWKDRMKDGISVFNTKVRLPSSANPFSVIPAGHRAWLEAVLEKGERSAPPSPGHAGAAPIPAAQPVASDGKVRLENTITLPSKVRRCFFHAGIIWTVTEEGVYRDNIKIMASSPRRHMDIIPVQGDEPLIGEWHAQQGRLDIFARDGAAWKSIQTSGYFVAHGKTFTSDGSWLMESTVLKIGTKLTLMSKPVAQTVPNARFGAGCLVQPLLGTCRVVAPLPSGGTVTVHFKQLDRVDLISAACAWPFVQIVGRENHDLKMWTAVLSATGAEPTAHVESIDDTDVPAIAALDRGVAARFWDKGLDLFNDPSKPLRFEQPGLAPGTRLASDGGRIYALAGKSVSSIKTGK
jgi:hypothetical protein